ncbi:MAG: hypothetical protein JWN37_520 [Candidatus Nomurabacteria bacterium]|nr:hypothetical protein [Candidatus Nomurabacteria bacterium]
MKRTVESGKLHLPELAKYLQMCRLMMKPRLNQREFSQKIGTSDHVVIDLECGVTMDPKRAILEKWAKVTGGSYTRMVQILTFEKFGIAVVPSTCGSVWSSQILQMGGELVMVTLQKCEPLPFLFSASKQESDKKFQSRKRATRDEIERFKETPRPTMSVGRVVSGRSTRG